MCFIYFLEETIECIIFKWWLTWKTEREKKIKQIRYNKYGVVLRNFRYQNIYFWCNFFLIWSILLVSTLIDNSTWEWSMTNSSFGTNNFMKIIKCRVTFEWLRIDWFFYHWNSRKKIIYVCLLCITLNCTRQIYTIIIGKQQQKKHTKSCI